MRGVPADASKSVPKLGAHLPPAGSVLVAHTPEALAQMLDDGVNLPIYTKKFGGEYNSHPAQDDVGPVTRRMNDVNAPVRNGDVAGGAYTQQLVNIELGKRREDRERKWNERITNDARSLANGEMLEKALTDFADGNISNQTIDRVFKIGGAPMSGTQVYLTRRTHAAEIEKRVLNDPELARLPAPQRAPYLEKILVEGAKSFKGQWDKESWRQWGEFTAHMRDRVAGMETANEKRQYYLGLGNNAGGEDDQGKLFSGVVPDMARDLVRSVIAAGHDLSVVEPSAGDDFFRMPGKNIGHGLKEWWDRASDSARVEWSKHFTEGQKGFIDELLKLKVSIDLGELPMNDGKALGAWLEQHASALSRQQAGYYKEVMGDEPWNPAYAVTNGLLHPENAALLANYLQTRDPKVWDQLTSQLARTPRRAKTERESEERLRSDSVVTYLNVLTDRDYKDAMKLAGDPINLAAMLLPALRTARAGEVLAQGSKVDAVLQAARGSVESVALGNIGLAIQDPNASWARHVQTSKDMLAFSLAATGVRAGINKAEDVLPKLLTREQARGKQSTSEGFGKVSSELVTPLNSPAGTMMMDATGVITLSRALVTAARDARDFASWSARATGDFGKWTEPHLEGLWDAAKRGAPAVAQYLHDKVPEKELQAIQLPEELRSVPPKTKRPAPTMEPVERPSLPLSAGQGTAIDRGHHEKSEASAAHEVNPDASAAADALRSSQQVYTKALESLPRDGAPAILPKPGHAIADIAESRRFLDGKLAEVKPSAPPVTFKLSGGFEGRLSLPSLPSARGGVEPMHEVRSAGSEPDLNTPVLRIVHESDPQHALLERPVNSGEQAYKALAGLRDTLRTGREGIEEELARAQEAEIYRSKSDDEPQAGLAENLPKVQATTQREPFAGDADYTGAPFNKWKLPAKGEGAHLVERHNVATRPDIALFDQKGTPRYYPAGAVRNAGDAHVRMHQATARAGIKRRGGNLLQSSDQLIEKYRVAYADPSLNGIRGDLRTPSGKINIAKDVTPAEAFEKLLEWFRSQKSTTP